MNAEFRGHHTELGPGTQIVLGETLTISIGRLRFSGAAGYFLASLVARVKEPHATRDWSAESAHTKATPRKRDVAAASASSNTRNLFHISNLQRPPAQSIQFNTRTHLMAYHKLTPGRLSIRYSLTRAHIYKAGIELRLGA
jgi:hypothetical protein